MHVCRGVGMCMYRGVGTGVCEEWLARVCINSGWHVRVCRVVGMRVCAEGLLRAFVKNGGTCMSMWDWHVHVCRGVGMCMYRGVDTGMCEEWLAHVCINSGWHVCV